MQLATLDTYYNEILSSRVDSNMNKTIHFPPSCPVRITPLVAVNELRSWINLFLILAQNASPSENYARDRETM